MILWVDGAHDPAENMRRDRLLLARAESGAEPVLRLFRFHPPGITLGAGQRPDRELDLGRCAADGVPWALRPTGGRAIFHVEEWTYSLSAPISDPQWGGSLDRAYARASELIAASLRRLGVPVSLARTAAREDRVPRERGAASAPCFVSAARHEIVLKGRKLVGSAQRRTRTGLLQQGSVLLGEGHLGLAEYLALPSARRPAARERLERATCHVGNRLDPVNLDRWAETLAELLPPDTRRVDAAAGAFLLTVSGTHSYTAGLLERAR